MPRRVVAVRGDIVCMTQRRCRHALNKTPEPILRNAGLSDDTCASQHLEQQPGGNERPRIASVFSRSPGYPIC